MKPKDDQQPSNPNGDSQWHLKASGKIPPVAFGLPDDAFDTNALLALEHDSKSALTEFVDAQLRSRFGDVYVGAKIDEELTQRQLTELEKERVEIKREYDLQPREVPDERPCLEMPEGWLAVKTWFYVVLLFLLALSEWINAAQFFARNEVGSIPLAMFFTFIFAVGAIAVKEWACSYDGAIAGVIRVASPPVGLFCFASFVLFFSYCFPPADSGVDPIAQMLSGGTTSSPRLRWPLLALQIASSTTIAWSLLAAISKDVRRVCKQIKNPVRVALNKRLAEIDERIDQLSERKKAAESILVSWEGSVQVHVFTAQGKIFAHKKLQEVFQKKQKALDDEAGYYQRSLPRFPSQPPSN